MRFPEATDAEVAGLLVRITDELREISMDILNGKMDSGRLYEIDAAVELAQEVAEDYRDRKRFKSCCNEICQLLSLIRRTLAQ